MFLLFEVERSIVLVRNTKKSHQKVLSVPFSFSDDLRFRVCISDTGLRSCL